MDGPICRARVAVVAIKVTSIVCQYDDVDQSMSPDDNY
ncbi:grassy tillers1 [Zea mays]|uniref:Grassy tillers1 n=1 Tax=Zea mays TaxID=4577 RepID=A0A1D6JSA8_MAIZE|nr:grassy tillers1 [Zea mays]